MDTYENIEPQNIWQCSIYDKSRRFKLCMQIAIYVSCKGKTLRARHGFVVSLDHQPTFYFNLNLLTYNSPPIFLLWSALPLVLRVLSYSMYIILHMNLMDHNYFFLSILEINIYSCRVSMSYISKSVIDLIQLRQCKVLHAFLYKNYEFLTQQTNLVGIILFFC